LPEQWSSFLEGRYGPNSFAFPIISDLG